jgi:hypothetical protein
MNIHNHRTIGISNPQCCWLSDARRSTSSFSNKKVGLLLTSTNYHCSIFIHLPPTLYNVSLPVLQFSRQYHCTIAPYSYISVLRLIKCLSLYDCFSVSTNAPYSYIYHQRCTMFLSQYFSFPLSVSFHQCSILIHISPALYNFSNCQRVK